MSPAQVQALCREKLDSRRSPRTVDLMHTTLHKALKQAVKWRIVSRSVTKAVNAPRLTKKELQIFALEQANVFLKPSRETAAR